MMRPLSIFCVALLLASSPTFGQDNNTAPSDFPPPQGIESIAVIEPAVAVELAMAAQSSQPLNLKTYVVKLTEFRFKTPSQKELSSQEIVQRFSELKDNDQIDKIQTISLSALAGYQSWSKFGKQISVTTGISGVFRGGGLARFPQEGGPANPPGAAPMPPRLRSTQFVDLGTILKVTAHPQGDKVLLDVKYESSRVVGDIPEDTNPNILTVQVESTLSIEPGKPTLISGATSQENDYLILVIEG